MKKNAMKKQMCILAAAVILTGSTGCMTVPQSKLTAEPEQAEVTELEPRESRQYDVTKEDILLEKAKLKAAREAAKAEDQDESENTNDNAESNTVSPVSNVSSGTSSSSPVSQSSGNTSKGGTGLSSSSSQSSGSGSGSSSSKGSSFGGLTGSGSSSGKSTGTGSGSSSSSAQASASKTEPTTKAPAYGEVGYIYTEADARAYRDKLEAYAVSKYGMEIDRSLGRDNSCWNTETGLNPFHTYDEWLAKGYQMIDFIYKFQGGDAEGRLPIRINIEYSADTNIDSSEGEWGFLPYYL